MFRVYRELEKNEVIVVGVDSAMGLGDFVAAQFVSKTKLDVPIVYHSPSTMTECLPSLHEACERIFDQTTLPPLVAIERANGGAFEMDRLAALNRLAKYNLFRMPPEKKKLGWDTNLATRPKMLQDLKEMVDNRVIRIYDKETINELFSFVKVQTSTAIKAQAEKGAHDDLVMALAISVQLLQSAEAQQVERYVPESVRRTIERVSERMKGFY